MHGETVKLSNYLHEVPSLTF